MRLRVINSVCFSNKAPFSVNCQSFIKAVNVLNKIQVKTMPLTARQRSIHNKNGAKRATSFNKGKRKISEGLVLSTFIIRKYANVM